MKFVIPKCFDFRKSLFFFLCGFGFFSPGILNILFTEFIKRDLFFPMLSEELSPQPLGFVDGVSSVIGFERSPDPLAIDADIKPPIFPDFFKQYFINLIILH